MHIYTVNRTAPLEQQFLIHDGLGNLGVPQRPICGPSLKQSVMAENLPFKKQIARPFTDSLKYAALKRNTWVVHTGDTHGWSTQTNHETQQTWPGEKSSICMNISGGKAEIL